MSSKKMDDIEDGELPSSPEIDDEPYKPLERPSLPPQMVSFIILSFEKIVK
jgi:hypothetical protein